MDILIKKAVKGDPEAFIEIINKNEITLYKTAKAILNNEDDIGDAIQEAILAAYNNIGTLKNTKYFKTWLTRILINKCNDIIRKNKNLLFIEEYKEGSYNEELDEKLDFNNAFSNLSSEHKIVLNLYYVSGFNSREIAEILEVNESTIKSRISRAKKKLKSFLSNSENGVKKSV